MGEYVEFSGKDVDEAIANACRHFGIEREKLEVEIVSGGSSGIFGLVGVKKAMILAQIRGTTEKSESRKNIPSPALVEAAQAGPDIKQAKTRPQSKPAEPDHKSEPQYSPDKGYGVKARAVPGSKTEPEPVQNDTPDEPLPGSEQKPEPQVREAVARVEKDEVLETEPEAQPSDPELKDYVYQLMVQLTAPFSPQARITVNDQTRPISVIIKDETTSEILIGRDGQTLSAIQYIANRIIAKNRPGAARVQLDTEDFLEKQNEKLQQNAFQLAVKAKKIGKTMSTRPLSSYHRRIVHMALQSDKKIRTKSKGDGPMKRVLIMPKHRRRKTSQE